MSSFKLGICSCGCESDIPIRNKMKRLQIYKHGHNRRGQKHPNYIPKIGEQHYNWKGGRLIEHGYILIWKPDHPHADHHGYVKEHRLIVEEYLGRYLLSTEEVHHINEIRDDNRIENLQVLSKADHTKLHHERRKQKWIVLEK